MYSEEELPAEFKLYLPVQNKGGPSTAGGGDALSSAGLSAAGGMGGSARPMSSRAERGPGAPMPAD